MEAMITGYTIPQQVKCEIRIPVGGSVIGITDRGGSNGVMWVLHDAEKQHTTEVREFLVVGQNRKFAFPDGKQTAFVGAYEAHNGTLAYFVYEILRAGLPPRKEREESPMLSQGVTVVKRKRGRPRKNSIATDSASLEPPATVP